MAGYVNYPYACRNKVSKEGYDGCHRCDGIDPGNAGFAYIESCNDAVAKQHQVHHRFGECT